MPLFWAGRTAAFRTAYRSALFFGALLAAPPPKMLTLDGAVEGVHDPVITKCNDAYYVFATGGREGVIPIRKSADLLHWQAAGWVFPELPDWAKKEISGARGAWAPDISYFGGLYHLYYSVSTFGSRNSAIGLATNPTLDAADPNYKWADQGLVLRSHQDRDDWNAIDPNLVVESPRRVWLAWGSFWSGIKMRRVDPSSGKLLDADPTMYSLCRRERTQPVGGSVEAPFIVKHAGYWYLFVSYDRCCRGAQSTYNVVVGRSKRVTGPYADRAGKPLTEGGGTQVIQATTPNWRGPGHEAVFQQPGQDYLLFHAYHGSTGRPFLHISTMSWENGWPRVATLP